MNDNSQTRSKTGCRCVLFDFGGVVAEEGFESGLKAIARRFHLDPDYFHTIATELVYRTGYVTGQATEAAFWDALRRETGITAGDSELTSEILSRFVVRKAMISLIIRLRQRGLVTAILSDQSDWLDRLEKQYAFFRYFHAIYNSFHLGKTKRDPALFGETALALGIEPVAILFVDDNAAHVERAAHSGMDTHLFVNVPQCEAALMQRGLL